MTIRIETPVQTPDVEPTVELFNIDGTSYHIPTRARPQVSLKYLKLVRQEGETFAASWLLEKLVGAEGFEALSEYEDLTDEQFKAIMKAARGIAMGSVVPDKS